MTSSTFRSIVSARPEIPASICDLATPTNSRRFCSARSRNTFVADRPSEFARLAQRPAEDARFPAPRRNFVNTQIEMPMPIRAVGAGCFLTAASNTLAADQPSRPEPARDLIGEAGGTQIAA